MRKSIIFILLISLATCAYADSIKPSQGFDPGAIRASGGGPTADWIDMTTGVDAPSYVEGRVFWDKDNGCIGVYPEVDGPIMQVGQELWVRVKNEEVATFTNGTVVYLSPPNTGSDPVAKLADASIATMSPVIGVVTHDISPDTSGYVTCNGLVRNLNTQGIPEGTKIFLSETPGSYTATVPAAPASSIIVGYCLKEHDSAGLMFVRVWLNGSIERATFNDAVHFVASSSVRTDLDVYSRDEVDALTAQSTLRYYFDETSSDIVGYESFATSPVMVQASDAITLTTSLAQIDAWVTPANTPNLTTLVTGIYEVELFFSKTGVGDSTIITELWSRDTGGTETFIASSTAHTLSGVISSPVLEVLRFSVSAPVTVASTDRLVVKMYGYRGAATAGLVLWYGGVTGGFFGVPISPRNFMRVDASNADLAEAQSNLGITADIANLAAHVASTGTSVHGMGTMATEAKTNYVATSTLTAHESDTSTHGKTTIAGMEDIDDLSGVTDASTARTNLGVAASSSTVLTSGANAMTGNLRFSDHYGILQSTSDGADSGYVVFGGGGAAGNDRGGTIYNYGNEHVSAGGQVRYYAGSVSTGDHIFYTGAGTERLRLAYDGSSVFTGKIYLNAKPASIDTNVYISNGFEIGLGDGTTYPIRFQLEQDSSATYFHSNLYYSGGWKCFDTNRAASGIRMFCGDGESYIAFFTNTSNNASPNERMRLTKYGHLLIGTTTDDGTNKLQVNGPVYVASYVSALGYIDRTEAPDTLADAYEIVNSHEVNASGELDHSKLSPKAYGKKVLLQPTGRMIEQVVSATVPEAATSEKQTESSDASVTKETSSEIETQEGEQATQTVLVPEVEQAVVPDPSGRDISMVISAQAFVIKDLQKRIEALEASR